MAILALPGHLRQLPIQHNPLADALGGDGGTRLSAANGDDLAADRYGQRREDMLRVARCESELLPTAVNRVTGDYGLFQFKPGTWLSTPYGEYDIFDPRASAYAAGWMWSVGRRNEWVCQ